MLKTEYKATPYSRKTKHGIHVAQKNIAKETATFLAEEQWGPDPNEANFDRNISSRIIFQVLGSRLDNFYMDELKTIIRKVKRGKAPGPDENSTDQRNGK